MLSCRYLWMEEEPHHAIAAISTRVRVLPEISIADAMYSAVDKRPLVPVNTIAHA